MPETIERARLTSRLTEAAGFPVALVRGAAGCGKSTALRDYLGRVRRVHAFYDVGPEAKTLARFVRGFAAALTEHAPGIRMSFGSAYERAIQSTHTESDLAAWMHEHLKSLQLTIAIDNLHNAAADTRSERFVGAMIEASPANVTWIVATRSTEALPVPVWMADRRMDVPLDDRDLAFDPESIAELARALGVHLATGESETIFEHTDGWATGVSAALHARLRGDAIPADVRSFAPLIGAALRDSGTWELRALLATYYLPDLEDALLPDDASRDAVRRLYARAPYLFTRAGGVLRYHDRLADALAERLAGADSRDAHAAISAAGQALRRQERFVEALALYTDAEHVKEAANVLEHRGVALVEHGDADVVERALERIERSGLALSGIVLALRAIVDSRLGRLDTSESWFNQALARSDAGDVRMVEIEYLYACDLLRRDRLDALDLLGKHAESEDLPRELRALLRSALAQGLIMAGRSDDALAAIASALVLAREVDDDALSARVLARAAYVSLYAGMIDEAKEYARAAASSAAQASLFHVATGAYSVLYAIAADAEDPRLARDCLDGLLESGLKAGNLQYHYYYLATVFEIGVERHDLEELARIDAALKSFDVQYDDALSSEALLPGQALRATWTGQFEYAYRLLQPTAVQQAGDDRVALRWAEIALYAAAAGRARDSADAIAASRGALARAEHDSKFTARTPILLALANVLLGRLDEAAALLAAREASKRQRLVPLADAVDALRERATGARNHDSIDAALRELEERDFGGFARLIEALPLELLVPA